VALHHTQHYLEATQRERRDVAEAREVERMVRRAAANEHGAWQALVARFGQRVTAVARAHRLAAHDVDDVAQATWLRLFEQIDRIREPAYVGAWLHTTARRESLRTIRHSRREQVTSPESLCDRSEAPADEEVLAGPDTREAMVRALGRLSERDRRLLLLLFEESPPSYAEISATLGIPIGSIGPTRARCLERLRSDGPLMAALRPQD
jgi:RNA polymerase sigma factor (sigma-70 family)